MRVTLYTGELGQDLAIFLGALHSFADFPSWGMTAIEVLYEIKDFLISIHSANASLVPKGGRNQGSFQYWLIPLTETLYKEREQSNCIKSITKVLRPS